MKALITGGCGFIGSHVAEQLLELGHTVTIVDNLASGRLENISSFEKHPKLRLVLADINNYEKMLDALEGIDWVFHLAGVADIVPSIESPDVYFKNNVVGTFNVLQAARQAGVKRLVYAASSSSYGIPKKYPTPETAVIQPEYPYALTKYMGEELVLHWARIYMLPAISLRLFNVYGPRARTSGAYGAVFGVFLAQKINGRPFTVVGNGEQTRDFTYVTDVARAFILAAQSDARAVALNVGSGKHYSVNYLVRLLGGDKIYVPKRPGEPDCTYADISKIKKLIGWTPKVTFEEECAGVG
jgi:UDP-glucose 4-epimerase